MIYNLTQHSATNGQIAVGAQSKQEMGCEKVAMQEVNTDFDNCEVVTDVDVLSILNSGSYSLTIGVDTLQFAGDLYGFNSREDWVCVVGK